MYYWRWFNRPRHPILQLLLAVLGIVALVGVLMLGFFALLAFAFIGGIVALVRAIGGTHAKPERYQRASPARTDSQVIEGEYVIVHEDTASLKH